MGINRRALMIITIVILYTILAGSLFSLGKNIGYNDGLDKCSNEINEIMDKLNDLTEPQRFDSSPDISF